VSIDKRWDARRRDVVTFITRVGQWPNPRSEDKDERGMYTWILTQRLRVSGKLPRLAGLTDDQVALLGAC